MRRLSTRLPRSWAALAGQASAAAAEQDEVWVLETNLDDLPAEVARLRAGGVRFRNDIVTGPGGSQILLQDPAGNLVELFQPAGR